MKFYFCFVLLLISYFEGSLAADRIIKTPLTRIKSLREKLFETGQWEAFYNQSLLRKSKLLNLQSSAGHDNVLRDYVDTSYVATIKIGTPPKKFNVLMDTGSADLWVPTSPCSSSGCCQNPCAGKNKYIPSSSSSYKPNGATFSIQYGTGSCSGTYAQEVVLIGDLQLNDQDFGMADELAQFFTGQHFDGICGLGYQVLNTQDDPPVHVTMYNQGLIDKPMFSVYLAKRGPKSDGSTGGQISFGGIDYTKVKGYNSSMKNPSSLISWAPVTREMYWQFNLDGIKVGGHRISYSSGSAISDTGTSFIIGDATAISQIASHLGNPTLTSTGIYQYKSCSDTKNLPNLYFTINGKDYVVERRSYIVQFPYRDHSGYACVLAMQGGNPGAVDWILGDTFIREWVQVYDFGNNRIGFGRSVDAATNVKLSGLLFSCLLAVVYLFQC